jgi:hypothetical protein
VDNKDHISQYIHNHPSKTEMQIDCGNSPLKTQQRTNLTVGNFPIIHWSADGQLASWVVTEWSPNNQAGFKLGLGLGGFKYKLGGYPIESWFGIGFKL